MSHCISKLYTIIPIATSIFDISAVPRYAAPGDPLFHLTTETRGRFHDFFALFPQVVAHLEGATPTPTVREAVTGTCRLARVYRDTVALVGDASGGVDAITGEASVSPSSRPSHLERSSV